LPYSRRSRNPGDWAFFAKPGEHSDSIAASFKHVAGNLASRWTDFLTTDDDKPCRDRNGEFSIDLEDTRAALLTAGERGRSSGGDQAPRLARGLTTEDLARRTGCANARRNAGRIDRCKEDGTVSGELLSRLADALNIDYPAIERLLSLNERGQSG
jgi:hypothetical protein